MKGIKLDNVTQTKKLKCDRSDEKSYLIQYRLLKFYKAHEKIVGKKIIR